MRTAIAFSFMAGLALAIALVAWRGADVVLELLGAAGWAMLWVPAAYAAVVYSLGVGAWRLLFPPGTAPTRRAAYRAVWFGSSVNWLLPAAQIGGELVRIRVIAKWGASRVEAFATVVVDKTIQALSQPAFALVGVVLLLFREAHANAIPAALAYAILLGAGIYGFYRVQRRGMFDLLARASGWLSGDAMGSMLREEARDVDAAIHACYGRRGRFWLSCLWRMGFRLILAGEVWMALFLVGRPVDPADAVIAESLVQIMVAAAFVVPGALGVQEGGFMVLGAALGFGADAGLALSLVRRVRELALGVPGLVAWQAAEGRWLVRRR